MPSRSFGKYILLEKIAAGGMAEIYKAAYAGEGDFRKICVLKRVLPALAGDDDFIRMFREEAALMVKLSHANVVHVFDFGREGEDYYLAMEFVRGISLRALLTRCQEAREKLPVKLALWIATEMTKGLGHAHSRRDADGTPLGIVHRDVSPANVLLSWDGEVKITDFGIAKMASRVSLTAEGMVRGKASYLSPEQASAQPLDGRTDLFAVGIVLWEMIAGKKLFGGDSPSEVMANVMMTPIPKVSSVVPSLPAPLDALMAKMLERDPDARFRDAAEQERAITSLLAKMGGANAADVASFLAARFEQEIADDRTRQQLEAHIPLAASQAPPPFVAPPAGATWTDDQLEPKVDRLDDAARRKMFDLPQPRKGANTPAPIAATAPASFLELDTGQIAGPTDGEPAVIETVVVGSMLVHVLRASAVAATAMAVLIAAIRVVYRY